MNKTNINENNKVELTGTIISEFEFSHEVCGEGFYTTDLEIPRRSGTADILKLLVSERLTDVTRVPIGEEVVITGEFRSFIEPDTGHLLLRVFVLDIESNVIVGECKNWISLDCYLCKAPVYRETPLGRCIADLLVAVNRQYEKSDCIPCIAWGRNAEYISQFDVGTHICVEGRIQSRVYSKRVGENEYEGRTVYEVSVSKLKILKE